MAKTPSRYEDEPDDEPKVKVKAEPKAEVKATATPKEADPSSPEHLEPYPEGDPGPDQEEVFYLAHGYYRADGPHWGEPPEPPVADPAKAETKSVKKDK
jgi:hypothetical protein